MPRGRRQDQQLFPTDLYEVERKVRFKAARDRIWTRNKALLIERYLYYFVRVTGHGTYIDGFAAPHEPGKPESWAAGRVIESQPEDPGRRRLRRFHLFEKDPERIELLQGLRSNRPDLEIDIYAGDFNVRVAEILKPDIIGPREATFCLTDQYTFECDWSTVDAIARHKSAGMKIEQFYFLANWWLPRAAAELSDERGVRWWGRPDWRAFVDLLPHDRAQAMSERFRELKYKNVLPWPIYTSGQAEHVAYYMIHASDHDRAPALMASAYDDAVGEPLADRQLAITFGMAPEDLG